MEKEIRENLEMVAEFMKWPLNHLGFFYYDYKHVFIGDVVTDWSKQIPVWAKLCREQKSTTMIGNYIAYNEAVRDDKPQEGFEIIVEILKRIKS